MIMHLGVNEIPRSWGQSKRALTTYDIARFIEARYHLMERFVDFNEAKIGAAIESSLHGAVQTRLAGGPAQNMAAAGSDIEDMLKIAISNRAFDGRISGVPTKASLRGINHRMKRPYIRRGPRPSFRDTGQFQSSIRCWFEETP